jgi:polyisoprenoid-binding protein YceI
MEIDRFPKATFTGAIIESIDFAKPGKYNVRAKGKFDIHGIVQPMMLDIVLEVKENSIIADTEFDILLNDYEIDIPRIVYKKIADLIHVKIHVELK